MPVVDKADDAIALWQQMIGEMQKGFRAFGNQPPPGTASHASDQAGAGPDNAQHQLAHLMENYFAGMNMPSRAQLNAMSDRLQAIEGELTEIKALLREALMNSRPGQDIPSPVRPPSKRPSSGKPQRRQSGPAEKATLVPDGKSK
jgi:hypothetical protein